MNKEVITNDQFITKYKSANPWFVLFYLESFTENIHDYDDEITRKRLINDTFIRSGRDSSIYGSRTRISSIVSIIRSGRVKEALIKVTESSQMRVKYPKEHRKAKDYLERINKGLIKLPYE